MEKNRFFTESRKELEQYLLDRLLLMKLQGTGRLARLVAVLFSVLVMAILAALIILFLSIMAGYYFADLTGSLYKGFGLVAGFYVLVLVLLVMVRRKYEKKIINLIIAIVLDNPKDDDRD
ncbi:hypothetical protein SAMN05444410_106105 [Hydrobacter penzbergensis]|jgi:hypothetical protein|uniref:Holin-X, holin superfamily III n=1 Tax=Hydrobacter penzbergensis TaxID=1235997 RepID=A0A8X8IC49_9BACT|nr:hypothetical protein [Hydrobacter penzbergensis]MBN8720413.1 hypothetical protein [Sediminibacterium magnilacihabitans]PQV60030.1 hypothetical protein CLV53_11155 [Sediminibacterium magnilacihabitans]SDW84201.1 hypothetical protein SAMN05444410_106105 [Hydrobacter penzbergensis]